VDKCREKRGEEKNIRKNLVLFSFDARVKICYTNIVSALGHLCTQ